MSAVVSKRSRCTPSRSGRARARTSSSPRTCRTCTLRGMCPGARGGIRTARASTTWRSSEDGSVGGVIIALGGICFLLGILKFFEVTSFKTPQPEDVQLVLTELANGDLAKAKTAAATIPGAGGALLTVGVEYANEKRGTLEEILYEKILAVRPKLERFLPFIALTAAAAPLLGLLGTVTGMIKTFNLITIFGTGDAKSLSSGIS